MTIEQHIEELRAELRNAVDPAERRDLVVELERARREVEAARANDVGTVATGGPS